MAMDVTVTFTFGDDLLQDLAEQKSEEAWQDSCAQGTFEQALLDAVDGAVSSWQVQGDLTVDADSGEWAELMQQLDELAEVEFEVTMSFNVTARNEDDVYEQLDELIGSDARNYANYVNAQRA